MLTAVFVVTVSLGGGLFSLAAADPALGLTVWGSGFCCWAGSVPPVCSGRRGRVAHQGLRGRTGLKVRRDQMNFCQPGVCGACLAPAPPGNGVQRDMLWPPPGKEEGLAHLYRLHQAERFTGCAGSRALAFPAVTVPPGTSYQDNVPTSQESVLGERKSIPGLSSNPSYTRPLGQILIF